MNICLTVPDGLGAEAAAAIAVLAALGEMERRQALHALGFAELRRTWTPRTLGALPTLTELVSARDREAIYGTSEWRLLYRKSGLTVVVYVLQARGLADLSALLGGVSVVKVGSALRGNLAQRIADLGARRYGGWIRGPRRYDESAGFEIFDRAPRSQLAVQHPSSPVRLCSQGIEVDLPAGMSPSEFESALNRVLLDIRLQTVADTDAGRALCARTGADPRLLRRYYRRGSGYGLATELAMFRPQADAGALAKACADIVIDFVQALQPKRPR